MRDEHDNNMTSMNIIDAADNNKRCTKARGVDIVRSILTMPRVTNSCTMMGSSILVGSSNSMHMYISNRNSKAGATDCRSVRDHIKEVD